MGSLTKAIELFSNVITAQSSHERVLAMAILPTACG